MSIMNTIKCWLGQHNTASENHFLDGSVANKLSIKRGTPNSPGAEVLLIDAGVVSFPQMAQSHTVYIAAGVGSGRVIATTYTNSTGQSIQVTVSVALAAGSINEFLVGGVVVASANNNMTGTNMVIPMLVTVPSGATYRVNGTGTIYYWTELR